VKLKLVLIAVTILSMSLLLISFSYAQVAQATMPYEPNPVVVVDGAIGANEYKGSYSETATGITIHWEHDGTNIYVALESPGTGWVGIVFGPSGVGMKDGNVIIGYVDASGEIFLEDNFGTGPVSHKADTFLGGSDNIVSKAGSEVGGKTIIEFVFPLDSGDQYDQSFSPGGTYGFNVAYQQTADDFTTYHTKHSASIDFYMEAPGAPPQADFSYILSGFTVEFTDKSSAQAGSIISWLWDFGDGTNSTEQDPIHTFPAISEYTVKLKVTDSKEDTATKTVKIDVPTKEERLVIWRTQVAVVGVAIALLSFCSVGITASMKKRGV